MIFIESDSYDPYWNLALEEYVFESLPKDQDYFLLWQNDNAVIVGKFQNTMAEIDLDGEREVRFDPGDEITIRITRNGPLRVVLDAALSSVQKNGYFRCI